MTKNNINYNVLKELAEKNKTKIDNLIALAPINDPFCAGKERDVKKAKWFVEIWHRYGYGAGIYLRRIHYQLATLKPDVKLPDGMPYENTDACWSFLQIAAKSARYLDLIDPSEIVDRRNPEPIIYDCKNGEPWFDVESDDLSFAFPELPDLPRYELYDFESNRRYHLEIWCEKTSMNDILDPLCREYKVDLITGMGEMSVSSAIRALERVENLNKAGRIFYISDFDPAGHGMPVGVARKIEFYNKEGIDIKLWPVMLTEEQVIKYRLPRKPIKKKEKRKENWEKRMGKDAVELDALEALHPNLFGKIIKSWINRYYDHTLDRRMSEERERIRRVFYELEKEAVGNHSDEIAEVKEQYEKLRDEFSGKSQALQQKQSRLWHAIKEELEENKPDESDYPPLKGHEKREADNPLYSSDRDYFEQLHVYKKYQKKHSHKKN